jgi:exonuclease SbcC
VDGAADAAMLKSKEIARKQAELSGKENEAAAIRGQLEEVEALEKRASAGTRKLQEQNALSDAMRVFRSEVIARITPALSQISSKLFQELTESKYAGMELNDEYEIEVLDGGKKYPLDRFSGGEADLANLCLRLAISKMISERSGNALNFLILDEIFGSQDQVRKRNIVNAFDQLSKQFSQIVLITHVEDMKDLINGAILVREKEDGSSEVLVTN